jgi:membrane protease YdiL (CAAX protease family)
MIHDEDNLLSAESPQPADPEPQSDHSAVAAPEFSSTSEVRNIPEDIRVPWDWLDLGLFVLIVVGGASLLGLLVVMGLGLFGVTPAKLQKSPSEWSIITVVLQMVLDLVLLGYLAIQMRVRFQSPFWRTIGWRPLETLSVPRPLAYLGLVFGGLFLGILVSWGGTFFLPKRPLPIQTMLQQDQRTAILFSLAAILLAPVVEETLFRGYLYPVAARSFGVFPGVIFTGVIFGLLHSKQLWGGWWQIFLIIVVGIVLTLVRAVTRTVWASYVVHTSYNSLQVLVPLIVGVSRYLHRFH